MSYFFAERGPKHYTETPAAMESFEVGDKVALIDDDDNLVLEIIGISEYGYYASENPSLNRFKRTHFQVIQAACMITEGIRKGSNGMALAVPGHLLYLKEHELIAL